jgi:hypothetical protein
MPAPTNPTNLVNGNPAIVEPTTIVPGTSVALNPAFFWTIFHTGRDATGAEDRNPIVFSYTAASVTFEKGEDRTILPAGGEFTLPKGTASIVLLAAGGAPLLNFVSNK